MSAVNKSSPVEDEAVRPNKTKKLPKNSKKLPNCFKVAQFIFVPAVLCHHKTPKMAKIAKLKFNFSQSNHSERTRVVEGTKISS